MGIYGEIYSQNITKPTTLHKVFASVAGIEQLNVFIFNYELLEENSVFVLYDSVIFSIVDSVEYATKHCRGFPEKWREFLFFEIQNDSKFILAWGGIIFLYDFAFFLIVEKIEIIDSKINLVIKSHTSSVYPENVKGFYANIWLIEEEFQCNLLSIDLKFE
jgi:hypothetical protein